jgi:2-polyprenylphenol 6-hydroxylase
VTATPAAARIIVAGGGPVGLAFACACGGFDVHVVEAATARAEPWPEAFEQRILAVSPGSRAFLRDLGAWEALDPRRIAPVRRMEIFGDGGARLAFSARPGAVLAWIVEAGRLADALEAQARSFTHVRLTRGTPAIACGADAGLAWVEMEGGARIEGELLVGADGPDSRVRSLLHLEHEQHAYGQAAVVANFETERPHEDIARQWFRSDGVLAWLPLPGQRISMVWSTPDASAEALRALEPAALAARVRDAGAAVLGDLRLASAPGSFALRSIRVARPVAPGVALIGDAAHAVHPLAGQGINLGFQDARVLVEALVSRSALERPGDLRVLRRYARGRREDVSAMQFVTDALDRLFKTGKPGVFALRNLGMGLLGTQDWARDALARRAMR